MIAALRDAHVRAWAGRLNVPESDSIDEAIMAMNKRLRFLNAYVVFAARCRNSSSE